MTRRMVSAMRDVNAGNVGAQRADSFPGSASGVGVY